MNFEVYLIFLIKPFFLHDQKVMKKNKSISMIFRAINEKNNTVFFLQGESPTLFLEVQTVM